jgi:hypothetical protein
LSPQPTTASASAAAMNTDLFIIVPLLDYQVIVEKTGLPARLMHRERNRQMT